MFHTLIIFTALIVLCPRAGAQEGGLPQSYQQWSVSQLEPLYADSAPLELLKHQLKLVQETDVALALIEGSEAANDPKKYADLVSRVPDKVTSPLLKRLLLGSLSIADPQVRRQAVRYFVKVDQKVRLLYGDSLRRRDRNSLMKSMSEDFREFQLAVVQQMGAREEQEDYLRSVFRMMLASDPLMQSWMRKALQSKAGFPRFPLLRLVGAEAQCYPERFAAGAWFLNLGGFATFADIASSISSPNLFIAWSLLTSLSGFTIARKLQPFFPDELRAKRATLEATKRDLQIERELKQQRQKLMEWLKPNCRELFRPEV